MWIDLECRDRLEVCQITYPKCDNFFFFFCSLSLCRPLLLLLICLLRILGLLLFPIFPVRLPYSIPCRDLHAGSLAFIIKYVTPCMCSENPFNSQIDFAYDYCLLLLLTKKSLFISPQLTSKGGGINSSNNRCCYKHKVYQMRETRAMTGLNGSGT